MDTTAGLYVIKSAVQEASHLDVAVCILGDTAVGKTSITSVFTNRPFNLNVQPTILYDICTKCVKHPDGNNLKFHICDTAGQERFWALMPNSLRNTDAIMLVYDITNRKSFEHLDKWLSFTYNVLPLDTPVIIVGNKVDLAENREVETYEGRDKAIRCNAMFKEASAKTGQCVVEGFMELSTFLRDRRISSLFNGERIPLSRMAIKLPSVSNEYRDGNSQGTSEKPCCGYS